MVSCEIPEKAINHGEKSLRTAEIRKKPFFFAIWHLSSRAKGWKSWRRIVICACLRLSGGGLRQTWKGRILLCGCGCCTRLCCCCCCCPRGVVAIVVPPPLLHPIPEFPPIWSFLPPSCKPTAKSTKPTRPSITYFLVTFSSPAKNGAETIDGGVQTTITGSRKKQKSRTQGDFTDTLYVPRVNNTQQQCDIKHSCSNNHNNSSSNSCSVMSTVHCWLIAPWQSVQPSSLVFASSSLFSSRGEN